MPRYEARNNVLETLLYFNRKKKPTLLPRIFGELKGTPTPAWVEVVEDVENLRKTSWR